LKTFIGLRRLLMSLALQALLKSLKGDEEDEGLHGRELKGLVGRGKGVFGLWSLVYLPLKIPFEESCGVFMSLEESKGESSLPFMMSQGLTRQKAEHESFRLMRFTLGAVTSEGLFSKVIQDYTPTAGLIRWLSALFS